MTFVVIKQENNTFSLHGSAVTRTVKDQLNEKLGMLPKAENCADVHFEWDKTMGHVSPGLWLMSISPPCASHCAGTLVSQCPRQTVKTEHRCARLSFMHETIVCAHTTVLLALRLLPFHSTKPKCATTIKSVTKKIFSLQSSM